MSKRQARACIKHLLQTNAENVHDCSDLPFMTGGPKILTSKHEKILAKLSKCRAFHAVYVA